MNIFYKPAISGETLQLDEKESFHCVRVMRYKIGDEVKLIDGEGGFYTAKIVIADPKNCKIEIISKEDNFEPLPYSLHIALAPTKSIDRFEWFLEKATEIGITSITPIICSRSERRNIRLDRVEKVVLAAMKQSVKAYKPIINELVPFSHWVKGVGHGSKYIAHCLEGEKEKLWQAKLEDTITIAIGPEGDFTSEEIDLAFAQGFSAASLGEYRLRTETAGIAACSAVYFNSSK